MEMGDRKCGLRAAKGSQGKLKTDTGCSCASCRASQLDRYSNTFGAVYTVSRIVYVIAYTMIERGPISLVRSAF